MDPTVCYRELYEAMQNGDYATAKERAESLKTWITRGGFYPPAYTQAEVDAYLVNVLRQVAECPTE